ncbi:unnamed protein product [Darwinula stevensoni]|uniref:AIG1-type G domain-containing protein n=1 Tax=Darwinula stevensoni TaxID=69355 RepID=A0A7R8X8B2_9CRUS|nr:unnamed protein product [Darwinula stevensoni]CAG0887900.1 unnamed protein product [Darwinula stevensoni]
MKTEKESFHEKLMRRSEATQRENITIYRLPFPLVPGRHQLGENKQGEKCLNVLLLGLTGSGKSMLVEVMGNYGLGVDFRDPYRFQVKDDGPTAKISSYTFFTRNQGKFRRPITLIDTPGFQKGTPQQDQMVTKDIQDYIYSKHPEGIHAIAYVLPGSQGRLTAEQKTVMTNMVKVLGDESEKISYLFCTFADSSRLPVLNAVEEAKFICKKHFRINSSSYFTKEEEGEFPSNDEEKIKGVNAVSMNEMLWNMTTGSIREFIEDIESNAPLLIHRRPTRDLRWISEKHGRPPLTPTHSLNTAGRLADSERVDLLESSSSHLPDSARSADSERIGLNTFSPSQRNRVGKNRNRTEYQIQHIFIWIGYIYRTASSWVLPHILQFYSWLWYMGRTFIKWAWHRILHIFSMIWIKCGIVCIWILYIVGKVCCRIFNKVETLFNWNLEEYFKRQEKLLQDIFSTNLTPKGVIEEYLKRRHQNPMEWIHFIKSLFSRIRQDQNSIRPPFSFPSELFPWDSDMLMPEKERLHEELKRKSIPNRREGFQLYCLPFRRISADEIYQMGKERQGEKCLDILFLGLTGSGKSMLQEVMGNYGLGVEFQDSYRFQMKTEDGPTNSITSHTYFTRDAQRFPRPVTLIDTPGFQKGTPEMDRQLTEAIRDFIHMNHPLGIHAVVYVLPGSQHFPVNSSSYFVKEEEDESAGFSSDDDEGKGKDAKVMSINELLWKMTTDSIREFMEDIQKNTPVVIQEHGIPKDLIHPLAPVDAPQRSFVHVLMRQTELGDTPCERRPKTGVIDANLEKGNCLIEDDPKKPYILLEETVAG